MLLGFSSCEEAPAPPTVIPVSSISLDKTSLLLAIGENYMLVATVEPSNAANKNVTWSSNNTNIATVSSAGLITARAEGTATITVTTGV